MADGDKDIYIIAFFMQPIMASSFSGEPLGLGNVAVQLAPKNFRLNSIPRN